MHGRSDVGLADEKCMIAVALISTAYEIVEKLSWNLCLLSLHLRPRCAIAVCIVSAVVVM